MLEFIGGGEANVHGDLKPANEIFVVDDASTMEFLSCLRGAGLVGPLLTRSRFASSGFAGAGLMRKMTLPFS